MVLRGFLKFFVGAIWILLIVLVIVIVGGYFAAKSIDPNIFRAELEKYLTQQTGMRVELGNIDIKWGAQLRLQLDGLKFYNPRSLEKLLQSDSVKIDADTLPLLGKKLWMPRIVILNPEVFIKKRKDGFWNWQPEAGPPERVIESAPETELKASSETTPLTSEELSTPVSDSGSEAPATPAKPSWEFGFGKIEIQDGTIHYIDETIQPAYTLQIVKCETEIFPKASLSAFHGVLRGEIWQATHRTVELEGDLDLIAQVFDFSLHYDKDRVYLKGALRLIETEPHFAGLLKIRGLDLETLVPEAYKSGEYLAGILDSDLRISFDGGNPDLIFQSLNATGTIDVENGSLRNRNLIKEILEKLSPVMTMAALFGGELPPEISEMVKGKDTDFQKASIELAVSNGMATFQNFYLSHPNYELAGKGIYGLLTKKIDLSVSLKFAPTITAYFVKKIHELDVLVDRNGFLNIPFRYLGEVPKASVLPDLQYIGSQLLQVGAQQLIEKGLEQLSKFFEPKVEATAQQ